MLRKQYRITIGVGIILLLSGIMLGSLVNVRGPSSLPADYLLKGRNSLIIMQVGEKGEGISGVTSSVPSWDNVHLIDSISYGVQGPADSEEGFKTIGKPQLLEIAIIRESDGASPEFFGHILAGTVFQAATLVGFASNAGVTEIDWQIDLVGVKFTSMAVVGQMDRTGTLNQGNLESITMKYQQITVSYTRLDGSGGSFVVSECWNVDKNGDC